jgi:hypothetical protein
MILYRTAIAAVLGLLSVSSAGGNELVLTSDSEVATAGYFNLSWSADEPGEFQLLERAGSPDAPARSLYSGPDTARVISGRSDGTYFYQVKTTTPVHGAAVVASDVVEVQVTHHPLSRAVLFFVVGAFVFVSTLVVIVKGNRAGSVK